MRSPALSRSLATPASNIGATKVLMSNFEPTPAYINYQRIEDNLAIVRQRYVNLSFCYGATAEQGGRLNMNWSGALIISLLILGHFIRF